MAKTDVKFTGSFTIEFGLDKLEAVLKYNAAETPEKVWAQAEIGELVKSHGIVQGYKGDDTLKALAQLQQKKESSFQLPIARGTNPVLPTPEELELEDLPVPEDLREAVQHTMAEAPDPVIEREVQTRVEVEKTVVKKGPLPFMPGKEEKVKVVERKTSREAVPVETSNVRYFYAEAGVKVGKIMPAKPGQAGRNVCGDMVQPANLADSTLYLGANLAKKNGEIVANQTGVVRVGKNWIDLYPFARHELQFQVSEDKATLFMSYHPGAEALPPPSYEEILAKAGELGFAPNTLVPEHEFADLLVKALEGIQALEKHPVTLPEDAFFDITVSDDKLKAVLNASKGSGHGKPLVLKEIGAAINASKLKLTDREKVKSDILAFFRSSERALIGYVLAEGVAPAPPPAQVINYSVEALGGKEYEKVRAQVGSKMPEDLQAFPLDRLSGLALVAKEQRVATLGTVVVGNPGMDVYGTVLPGLPSTPVELSLLGSLELNQGFVVAKIPGLMLWAVDGQKVWMAHIEHADSAFRVELSSDAMEGWLSIDGHRGSGLVINPEAVKAEITKQGIKKGLLESELAQALEMAVQGRDVDRMCIARGKPAKAGGASRMELLVDQADGAKVRIRADGTADYKTHSTIKTVKKDTALARLLPPDDKPEDGFDIRGKDLKAPANDGKAVELGTNVRSEVQADGSTLIFAKVDGELRLEKGTIDVQAIYTIKGHIDAQIGNLKFPGTIQVAGDIMAGFYVMAGGDIKVAGSIEGALVSADQEIQVQGGVKGHGKALLRARIGVTASFIEQATVMSVGDVKVKKTILRSSIKCNKRLLMPDEGRIIGGEIRVKNGMQIGSIGSENAIPTRVVFGQDILVEDQIHTVEKEIVRLQEEITTINMAMKHPDKIADKTVMQDLFTNKLKNMKLLEKHNLRLFSLKEQLEQHAPSEIIVSGTAHPGVVLECHGRTLEIHSAKTKVKYSFDTDKGHIVESEIESKSRK